MTEALAALKAVTAAALVLAAETATALKADDANDGDGGIAVVGCTSLATGDRLINLFHCLFFVDIIICISTRNKHSDSPRCEPITPLFRDQRLSHDPRLRQRQNLILGPHTNGVHKHK